MSGADLIVAQGAIPTTTPNRLMQATNDIENQGLQKWG
jgi:hypothetical protein